VAFIHAHGPLHIYPLGRAARAASTTAGKAHVAGLVSGHSSEDGSFSARPLRQLRKYVSLSMCGNHVLGAFSTGSA